MKQNPYPATTACGAFVDLVPVAGLNILSPDAVDALQRHLATCPHCRYEREVHQAIDQTVRTTIRRQAALARPFSRAELTHMLTSPLEHPRRRISMSEPVYAISNTSPSSHGRRRFILSALIVTAIFIAVVMMIIPKQPHSASLVKVPTTMRYATVAQTWAASAHRSLAVGNVFQADPSSHMPAFVPTDISSDGALIVGYENSSAYSAAHVVALRPATGAQQQIVAIPDDTNVYSAKVITDGRYIAWTWTENIANSDNTFTVQPQFAYIDTETGKLSSITIANQSPTLFLEHGHLFWLKQVSAPTPTLNQYQFLLEDTDLSSGKTRDLHSSNNAQLQGVCWPDVIYDNMIFDITTGKTAVFSLPTPSVSPYYKVTVAACNDTIAYASFGVFHNGVQGIGFLEADHLAQTPLSWQNDDVIAGFTGTLLGANNSLMLLSGENVVTNTQLVGAWDRQRHVFVMLPTDFNQNPLGPPFLRNHWLVYISAADGKTYLNIIDTTRLG